MKPKLIDRFILWLLLILLIAIAAALIGISFHFIPITSINFLAEIIYAHQINAVIVGCIGLVILALALRVMFAGKGKVKSAPQPATALIQASEQGSIFITLAAIDGMVQKHVRNNDRIKGCESQITAVSEGIAIKLKLSLLPDTNIPELTTALQASVKEYIESLSGIQVTEVTILVGTAAVNSKTRAD